MKKDLRYYENEFDRRKLVFEDRAKFNGWVFEYACQRLKFHNIEPRTHPKELENIFFQQMEVLLKAADKMYKDLPDAVRFEIPTPSYSIIPEALEREFKWKK
jgi:hypothetical protein